MGTQKPPTSIGAMKKVVDMRKMMRLTKILVLPLLMAGMLTSCSLFQKKAGYSRVTGLAYGTGETDSLFRAYDIKNLPNPPGMVFIQGGRTILGSFEEDLLGSRDNIERTVTVNSFYMDETEITNENWKEYVFYTMRSDSSDEFKETIIPNDEVWASEFSFNDVYTENYYSNPGFNNYPVVGVTWEQINDYCKWRTSAVNNALRKDAGLSDSLSTKELIEMGISLPHFRLPNEAEWEYAAKAMIGTQYLDENQEHGRIYPWDGRGVRNPYGRKRGEFLANFKRGRGDYSGISGNVKNDGDVIPGPVGQYPPNDFGLYNMAGNVSEWVYDIYRPLSYQDFDDLNPVRKSGYRDAQERYGYAWKDPEAKKEVVRNQYEDVNGDLQRDQFRSLVNDRLRVYKGGSWKDVAYWMSPGTRRYMAQGQASNTIGFRCAMISVFESQK